MSNRRNFIKNISAGAFFFVMPKWVLSKKNRNTFADHWEFVGVAVQEPGYTIWGTSPVIGTDGIIHLFVARWPGASVDPEWRSLSEIAHYVGDRPEGPFRFTDIALEGSGKNTWDKYATSNPTIHKVGDQYVLLYIANDNYHQPPHSANQQIGMAISKNLYGPWEKVNGDGLILSPPKNPAYWDFKSGSGVANPALLQYKGGFLLYFKAKDAQNNIKMGLAVSENLTGPYEQLPLPITSNQLAIEDGYAFLYKDKICLLTTDNHGILKKGGGILWKSDDGVSFNDYEPGFKLINEYVDAANLKNPKWYYGPRGVMKFERPQILMIDGKPGYLYAASGCNIYGGSATISYVLKYVK